MTDVSRRIEVALEAAFSSLGDREGPPSLSRSLRYAVFPGGSRLRPSLLVEIANALGDPHPSSTDAAAASIELMHCASLVHDDLPCFDDAELRRGKPTVHQAFGEATAVLTGDALLIMAFETLQRADASCCDRSARLTLALCRGVGHPLGIIAGQAWESEKSVSLFAYHRAKTAALFEAACVMGAISGGAEPQPWRAVGELLGRAYQIADDLCDVSRSSEESGKSAGIDAQKNRPSAYTHLGETSSIKLCNQLIDEAVEAVPACNGRERIQQWLRASVAALLRPRRPMLRASGPENEDVSRHRAVGE